MRRTGSEPSRRRVAVGRLPLYTPDQHTRDNDLIVNVIQGKKLTNTRAAGKDENTILTPPMRLPLERALSYIQDDEQLEVTPKSIRLGKRWLDPNERKKRERPGAA